MKKFFALLAGLFCLVGAQAQYETTLEVVAAPSAAVKAAMERNGSLLLTELNNAQGENRSLSLEGIDITEQAAESLMIMWEVCPFRCDELDIYERCLHLGNNQALQVRNIPVIMEPRAGERFEEDEYQEIVLNFDNSGKIINLWKEPILKHNATSFMCDGFAFTDDIGDALQIIWDDNNKHYTDDSYTQDELSFSVSLEKKDVDVFLKTIVKRFGCAYNEKTKEITSANADELLSLLNYIYQTVNIFLGGSTEEKAPIKMFIRNLENLR